MNRLQKKCLIATAGFHLTLLLILIFGSAFFAQRQVPDDSQVLDVIPANLVDAAFNSGVRGAQIAQPTPPAPKIFTPPQPTPEPPQKEISQPVEKTLPPEKIQPDDLKPLVKPEPEKIKVDLTPVVRNASKNSAQKTADDAQKKLEQKRLKAIRDALRSIKNNSSSATEINLPGNSTEAYANYASIVKSIYDQAWTPPDNTASDDANTKVSVTIARDGSVISARILTPSGDASVDATVQRTLDRITFIAPFPDGTNDKERTYIINFNLKSKRMLG